MRKRKVIAYFQDGRKQEYSSIHEAARAFGTSQGTLSRNIKHHYCTNNWRIGKAIFRYADDIHPTPEMFNRRHLGAEKQYRPVIAYMDDGIREFKSMKDAADHYGLKKWQVFYSARHGSIVDGYVSFQYL